MLRLFAANKRCISLLLIALHELYVTGKWQ